VKAERDRRRLPRRTSGSRWLLRLVGVLATAAFLGVGIASALMIVPDKDSGSAALAVEPTATATPKPKAAKKKVKPKPKGPTKAQLAVRKAAVAELRSQGFTTLRQSDYDFKATLRVLIGRPVGDAGGGSYAFFFNKGTYLGKDSTSPSTKVTVAKQGKSSVTLSYDTSAGRTKVRFKLDEAGLQPLDPIPAPAERFAPRGN
jgi:LppP/LprE lipoprotein